MSESSTTDGEILKTSLIDRISKKAGDLAFGSMDGIARDVRDVTTREINEMGLEWSDFKILTEEDPRLTDLQKKILRFVKMEGVTPYVADVETFKNSKAVGTIDLPFEGSKVFSITNKVMEDENEFAVTLVHEYRHIEQGDKREWTTYIQRAKNELKISELTHKTLYYKLDLPEDHPALEIARSDIERYSFAIEYAKENPKNPETWPSI